MYSEIPRCPKGTEKREAKKKNQQQRDDTCWRFGISNERMTDIFVPFFVRKAHLVHVLLTA